MKKAILFFTIIIFATATFAQNIQPVQKAKLSPLTQEYLYKARKSGKTTIPIPNYVYKTGADNKHYISSLIKVNASVDVYNMEALGIHVGTKAGNIWTAQIPLEQVEAFTKLPGIEYIQLDEPIVPMLDSVRKATRADSAQAGYNLPMPLSGENVIVADIDIGFDYGHPLLFDSAGMHYRVKKVWEQKNTTGTPPAGFNYGTEIDDSSALWAKGTDAIASHGTHVTGICAGSGYGSSTNNKRYRGIAWKSDIVLVAILPDSNQWMNTGVADVIDAMNYVYNYATSVDKPAVVNLSWGSLLGPQDGTSLFSQAVDNLTGPGRIFVCAAGNNGNVNLHVGKTFSASDTLVQTFIKIDSTPIGKKTWVDIWGDSTKSFCTSITLYKGDTILGSTGFICLDNLLHPLFIIGSNNDTCFINLTTTSSDFNHKPRAFLDIYSKVNDGINISVKGTNGKINIWDSYAYQSEGFWSPFDSLAHPWAVSGNTNLTTSDITSTYSAISAGAYINKNSWFNLNHQTYSYTGKEKKGDLAPFSSHGPTVDGRIKPDITAPGMIVASGVNSRDTTFLTTGSAYILAVNKFHNPRDNHDYLFACYSGTSMAAPVVSGVAALMLQLRPDLTPLQIKNILIETAIKDKFTGTIPAGGLNTWGNGKVNAYGAVKQVLHDFAGVNNIISGTNDFNLYPNPNNGSFNIECAGTGNDKLKIEVYDLLGHLAFSENRNITEGYNNIWFNASSIGAGIYFIKIYSKNGAAVLKMTKE